MKKVKFMLMSLALLAVVGGALAFKAKFDQTFCTTTFANNCATRTCPVKVTTSVIDPNQGTVYCTTDPTFTEDGIRTCSYKDQNQVFQPITCNVTAKLTTNQ